MTDKHKVMWLIKGLGRGGAERLLTLGIPYLDRSTYDYEVSYLTPWKNDLVADFDRAGIPATCVQMKHAFDFRVIRRLALLFKEREVEILHVHSPFAAVLGRIAARIAGVPTIIYTEHNIVASYRPATRALHRLTSRADKATIAVSGEVHRSMLKARWFKPRKPSVIYGGIDLGEGDRSPERVQEARAALGVPDGHFVIGNIAHLKRPEKGHPFLLQAAKKIMDRNPNTTLVCIGREKDPDYLPSLKKQAVDLGIDDRVIFTGFVPDAMALAPAFDVFVLSSLFEGLPVAMMETMSMEIPQVLTSVGGIPEVIVDGENGFLVPPKDPELLAERVNMLIANEELRKRLGRQAKITAMNRFNVSRMVREIEGVYSSALASA